MQDAAISIQELTKRYAQSKVAALRGVTLDIQKGEFFGLLGPNGCGKTTLISIITGLIRSTSGRVTINGQDVRTKLGQIKPLIGLVPQEIALYPTLSIIENLKYFGRLYGLPRKVLKERIDECVTLTQLERFAKRPIQTFSGGMKRRANLAIGLVHNPSILFLDEITVNVDPQSRNVILDILKTLNKRNTTMIYTTHYLEEAQQLCERVAIMDLGQIIAIDSPDKLIEQTESAKDLGEVFLELTGHHLRD